MGYLRKQTHTPSFQRLLDVEIAEKGLYGSPPNVPLTRHPKLRWLTLVIEMQLPEEPFSAFCRVGWDGWGQRAEEE